MDEREAMKRIDEIVAKGGIVADIFTQFQESDAEKVKNAAVAFATAVKEERGVIFALSEIEAPEKQDDVYSTYVETRLIAKDIVTLSNVMMKHTPVGIEIVRPDKITANAVDLRDALMNVANNIYDLKSYIFRKIMTPEERAKLVAEVSIRMKEAEKMRKEGGRDGGAKG